MQPSSNRISKSLFWQESGPRLGCSLLYPPPPFLLIGTYLSWQNLLPLSWSSISLAPSSWQDQPLCLSSWTIQLAPESPPLALSPPMGIIIPAGQNPCGDRWSSWWYPLQWMLAESRTPSCSLSHLLCSTHSECSWIFVEFVININRSLSIYIPSLEGSTRT